MFLRKLLVIFVVLPLFACIPLNKKEKLSPKEIFASQIKYLINDPVLANSQIGIYIESITENSVLFKQNEYKLFVPASNQKLYTTAAALEKLGATYSFETEFIITGDISDSTLNGDLIIKGEGDPSISGKFRDADVLAYFRDWADSLKVKGILKISGNIIGDESYFSGAKLGLGWNWDDEPFSYSAQIGALSYNNNCIDLEISPGVNPGDKIAIKTNPETDFVQIDSRAMTIDEDSSSTFKISRARGRNIIELSGGLPAGISPVKKSITIENPAKWFLNSFSNVLTNQGIEVSGSYGLYNKTDKSTDPFQKSLFKHKSPAMHELVKVVNKDSDNFYAEQIFKTLGAEIKKKGTAKESANVIRDWLISIAVTNSQAIPVDGSGLSRMNLVSPYSTAALLKHMYYSKNFSSFYNSLPIAGVDGTLKGRMKNSAAQNVVRAKTGFVRYMRSLAGYTKDKLGNDYLFVIMVNYYSVPTAYVNKLQDKIAILLTSFDPDEK